MAEDNGILPAENAKRLRRPSVRLGEIGDQPAATATLFHRRPRSKESSSSKTRPLAKFTAFSYRQALDLEDEDDNMAIGSWSNNDSSNSKRPANKPRTNLLPKIEEGLGRTEEEHLRFYDRDFERQGLGSPSKDHSPANSIDENSGGGTLLRRHHTSSRIKDPFENDKNVGQSGRVWSCEEEEDGVTNWLNGLGLGRYWPVFEIHEVDEEVLPLLTLEDLKDMGITAVGSRRKMFVAIQKLRKGFS